MEGKFNRLSAAFLFALFVSSYAVADDRTPGSGNRDERWNLGLFGGQSIPILGSDEVRTGGGLVIEYQRREPRFKTRFGQGDMVLEGYVMANHGGAKGGTHQDWLNAAGVLVMSRWRWPQPGKSFDVFVDLGWGLQVAAHETVDLDSKVNSTPVLDFGVAFGSGRRDTLVGIRFLHISNGGLSGRNQGQNVFNVFVAWRM